MKTIAVFIDGANMFFAQRAAGWHIDYSKVLGYFSRGLHLHGAYYYTATPPVGQTERVLKYRQFRKALINKGFTIKDKEVKVIQNRDGSVKLKGNLDIELVMDMIANRENYDIALLMGGDTDFVPVVNFLRSEGKKVICVGRRKSTGLELINTASEFIDIDDIRDHIEKRRSETKKKDGSHNDASRS